MDHLSGTEASRHARLAVDGDTGVVRRLLSAIPDDIDTFRAVCSSARDWAAVVDCARKQGVLGVLLGQLRECGIAVADDVMHAAQRHCAVEQMWTSQVTVALEEALVRLRAEGVKVVSLKGPVLARRLYPDASARPSLDADLLVEPGQMERAEAVLETLGYRGQSGPAAAYARAYEHHVQFYRPDRPAIELHFRLYAGFGTVIGAAESLDRAVQSATAAGSPVWVLAPEDEALYLALHAAGHSYVRLLWLYDLKLLLLRHPALDWALVAERAHRAGVASVVAFTCQLLRDCLGVAAPSPSQLGVSAAIRWRLARRLLPTVMRPTARSPRENFESLIFTCLLCDRPSAGAGLVRHHVARALKRRARRMAPALVPEAWSA